MNPVVADFSSRCAAGSPITLTEDSGHIPGPLAPVDSTQHGGSTRPPTCVWRIRVASGQRINLTLFDFGRHYRQSSGSSGGQHTVSSGSKQTTICIKYALVTESPVDGGTKAESSSVGRGQGKAKPARSAVICGGSNVNDRQRFVYASESNSIDVETFAASPHHTSKDEWTKSGADSASSSSPGGRSGTGSGGLDNEGVQFLIRYDGTIKRLH